MHAFVVTLLTFSKLTFKKKICQEYYQIANGLDPVLDPYIYIYTVCKGNQQMTKITAGMERVD